MAAFLSRRQSHSKWGRKLEYLRKILVAVASLLLMAMVASLFLQVIAREFRLPVDWTEETGRFTFIAMVFFAACYNTMKRSHLRVTIFADILSGFIGQRSVDFVHTVILLGFGAIMAYYSGYNFIDGLQYPNISPALRFNQNLLFSAMCLGFVLITLLHVFDLFTLLRGGHLDAQDGGEINE